MSIIIHGFYKPERCRYCPFCIPTERDRDDSPYECVINITLHWANWLDVPNYIPKGCKISGIPTTHGDLIDRDKLCEKQRNIKLPLQDNVVVYLDDVIEAPAVIEAEQDNG